MNNGYKVIRKAFDTKLLDLIDRDFETIALQCKPQDVFRTKNGDVKQIQNCQDWDLFKQISNIIKNEMGYDGEVLNMQYFIKHPDYKITAPHQDGAYFDSVDDDILTFWIPLHDVSPTTSTMFYVDWDGNREIIPHDDCGSNVRTRTGKTGMSQYTSVYKLEDFTPVVLSYGDCVVHNQFSVHYSNENSTVQPRIAITCIIKLNKNGNK
jgi:ectoine hydroxylase-related dioxygenase (phytanoyl-CoA dioxygenase family)